MTPNLLEIAIRMVPRVRDCRFSSVTSRGSPAKAGPSAFSNPATALSIGTTWYPTPRPLARSARRLDGFAERRELAGERAIAVQGKRGAVEHELVLPADLVDIDQRHAALGHPRHRDVETELVLVTGIG